LACAWHVRACMHGACMACAWRGVRTATHPCLSSRGQPVDVNDLAVPSTTSQNRNNLHKNRNKKPTFQNGPCGHFGGNHGASCSVHGSKCARLSSLQGSVFIRCLDWPSSWPPLPYRSATRRTGSRRGRYSYCSRRGSRPRVVLCLRGIHTFARKGNCRKQPC
jgi:hypothetical protein